MNEKKVVTRSVAIALGIITIVLVAGLVGAFAFFNARFSHDSQTTLQSWTEGDFYFNLTNHQDVNFTILTAGFSSVTITIDALTSQNTSYPPLEEFSVFIGFITVNTTVDYQEYEAKPYSLEIATPLAPYTPPPWSALRGYLHFPASFRQTYNVAFSKIMVWIWESTAFYAWAAIWGNVYYYLTT